MRGGKTTAHHEKELLSHVFTKAVEWGYLKRHPFKGEVELTGIRKNDRYIEDWEIVEVLALESRRKKGSVRTCYAYGWSSMWQRFMERVLSETKVTQSFTEHGLRAQCASDATTLEHARALLSHADARTTKAFYRRKPEVVTPLKGAG